MDARGSRGVPSADVRLCMFTARPVGIVRSLTSVTPNRAAMRSACLQLTVTFALSTNGPHGGSLRKRTRNRNGHCLCFLTVVSCPICQ